MSELSACRKAYVLANANIYIEYADFEIGWNAALDQAARACDGFLMYEGEDNPAELCTRAITALKETTCPSTS